MSNLAKKMIGEASDAVSRNPADNAAIKRILSSCSLTPTGAPGVWDSGITGAVQRGNRSEIRRAAAADVRLLITYIGSYPKPASTLPPSLTVEFNVWDRKTRAGVHYQLGKRVDVSNGEAEGVEKEIVLPRYLATQEPSQRTLSMLLSQGFKIDHQEDLEPIPYPAKAMAAVLATLRAKEEGRKQALRRGGIGEQLIGRGV